MWPTKCGHMRIDSQLLYVRYVYTVRRRLHMEATIFVAIFVAIFLALISAFDLDGKRRRAARDRRIAEYKMNARLLRLNI
jgi:hypothetical protein